MLEKMHAARTRKEALETMKREAQDEARQRAAKAKAKRHQISMVHACSKVDDDYVPPMLLPISINHVNNRCNALLDSGADVNVMAAHIYEAFVTQALTSTLSQLNSVANQTVDCQGIVTASIYVNGNKEDCQFYVTKSEHSAHDIIFGRSWMSRHKCQFNWDASSISLVFANRNMTLPAADVVTKDLITTGVAQTVFPLPLKPTSRKMPSPSQRTYQQAKWLPSKEKAQPWNKDRHYKWVPKDTSAATSSNRQRYAIKPKQLTCQRWIPKQLLLAQGFYKGNRYIWVPKLHESQPLNTRVSNGHPTTPMQQGPVSPIQSATHTQHVTIPSAVNNILNQTVNKGKQVIKVPYSQDELATLQHTINSLPSTSSIPWCLDLSRQNSNLNIKQRAQLLQCKLFGESSLLTASQVFVC